MEEEYIEYLKEQAQQAANKTRKNQVVYKQWQTRNFWYRFEEEQWCIDNILCNPYKNVKLAVVVPDPDYKAKAKKKELLSLTQSQLKLILKGNRKNVRIEQDEYDDVCISAQSYANKYKKKVTVYKYITNGDFTYDYHTKDDKIDKSSNYTKIQTITPFTADQQKEWDKLNELSKDELVDKICKTK